MEGDKESNTAGAISGTPCARERLCKERARLAKEYHRAEVKKNLPPEKKICKGKLTRTEVQAMKLDKRLANNRRSARLAKTYNDTLRQEHILGLRELSAENEKLKNDIRLLKEHDEAKQKAQVLEDFTFEELRVLRLHNLLLRQQAIKKKHEIVSISSENRKLKKLLQKNMEEKGYNFNETGDIVALKKRFKYL